MQSGKVACITRELEDLLMMEEERGTFPKNSGSVADLLEEMETAVARVEAQREKEAGQQQEPELQRPQSAQHRSRCREQPKHRSRSHRTGTGGTENTGTGITESGRKAGTEPIETGKAVSENKNASRFPVRKNAQKSVCAGRNGKTRGCFTPQMP